MCNFQPDILFRCLLRIKYTLREREREGGEKTERERERVREREALIIFSRIHSSTEK